MVRELPLNITNPHTATAAIPDTYLGLGEPADSRSQSMYHLQNPVNALAPFRILIAQSVEHLLGVRKVLGANFIGDSDFFPSLFMYVSTVPIDITRSFVL